MPRLDEEVRKILVRGQELLLGAEAWNLFLPLLAGRSGRGKRVRKVRAPAMSCTPKPRRGSLACLLGRQLSLATLFLSTSAPALPLRNPQPLNFYVALEGKDSWSGTLPEPNISRTDGPFASLERAREAIRQLKASGSLPTGGVTVWIRGGLYLRDQTFELDWRDSGTEHAPITYRAYGKEEVRLVGGKPIGEFKPVTDEEVLARLDPSCRTKILQVDLKAQGIHDFGRLRARGFGRPILPAALELFFQEKPMPMARYPNQGWLKIASVPAGPQGGKFTYRDERPKRWKSHQEIWVHGYWTWDWADSYEQVKTLDPEKGEVATYEPHGVYGYKEGQRFYFLNVLEELDAPGEWYLDRQKGVLYFYPPEGWTTTRKVWVSLLEEPMVRMREVHHVTLQGLTFECSRGAGVVMIGGSHNLIASCTFRNLGTVAICIGLGLEKVFGELYSNPLWNRGGGFNNGIRECEIYQTGEGGIILGGGDRKRLDPASNFAIGNHLFQYNRTVRTYRPAIAVDGVGNRVAHNLIHDAPHMAILLHGNDHLIEFNEIHRVCMETNDAGALYIGRDWTQRGHRIQHNYFHHLGTGDVNAVYLDDWASGTTVFGNLFYKAGRGVLIGGGRDNLVANNIFVECRLAIQVDARGLSWAKAYFDGRNPTLFNRLKAVNPTQPPYSLRYPELATLLQDEPAMPKNNRIVRNLCFGGEWLHLLDGLNDKIVHLQDNFVGDPGFLAPEKGDFRLKEDSPAWRLGFKPIPLEKIGPRKE